MTLKKEQTDDDDKKEYCEIRQLTGFGSLVLLFFLTVPLAV